MIFPCSGFTQTWNMLCTPLRKDAGELVSLQISAGFVADAVWLGESPRGREDGQWRGGVGSTGCVTDASRRRERMSALGGESPRGREAGQWRGGFGSTDSVTESRTGADGKRARTCSRGQRARER